MGDVSEMLGVPASTIRYWDEEFAILKPKRSKKGNRIFTKEELKKVQMIHHLLKNEKLTIEGAKQRMANRADEVEYKYDITQRLLAIKQQLLDLKR